MSLESARKFAEKVKDDKGFAAQLAEFETSDERVAFVQQAGFDFTDAEWNEVREELGDDELDAVAAGGCTVDFCLVYK